MTGTITLTAAMRANLLSLQNTGTELSTTQLALATGNKVNSALDNPVNFFAAQSLNRRASSLSSLLDGMGQAIQTVQAANQGLTSITSLVNQLTSIVNSAKTDLKNQTTQDILKTAGASGIDSTLVGDLASTGGVTAGDAFSLADGSGTAHTFTIDAVASGGVGTSLQSVVDAINQVQGFQASIVYGDGTNSTIVGDAYLKVVSTDNQTITATSSSGAALATLGLGATGVTSTAVVTGGATGDVTNWTNVLSQIDQLAADASYQGNNLINGTGANLTVQVNELSQGAITINSTKDNSAGLGLTTPLDTSNLQTATDQINTALSKLQTDASSFANNLSLLQNRQDFTSNLINTLQSGASQLTIADKNEEGANLLALQTQQQLGIEALSLSSQANQSVLRLFA